MSFDFFKTARSRFCDPRIKIEMILPLPTNMVDLLIDYMFFLLNVESKLISK